jgi:3-oxoacyl-[acyl-carrier protein] reductase
MIDLTDRIALVTGASRGLGAATARALARAGADVFVHHRASAAAAAQVAADVQALGRRAWIAAADLGQTGGAAELAAQVTERTGRLDILVHNAGIWTPGRIASMSMETWRETMRVNLDAVFALTQALLPALGASRHAAIVVVTSTSAQRGEAGYSHYSASKGALVSWTKSAALELAPAIRVNSVAPGWVDTDMVREELQGPGRRAEIERTIPRGRVPTADEIAGPIVFLASDLAVHVTGEILNVNGGAVLCG